MKLERLSAMPGWPARMTADVAAMFLCMSEGSFISRYGQRGSYTEGVNRYWPREWLERQIARDAGLVHSAAHGAGEVDDTWDSLA